MKTSFLKRAVCALCSAFFVIGISPVSANVVISGTRVVYPASEREITLKLDNVGQEPSLVQVWIDRGDPQSRPDQADAPFLLTPPIVRISAGRSQTLRITYTHDPLPTDVESVFWLNVLDVPPNPKNADSNFIQLAYRSRIKLFYRPEQLKGYAEDAPAAVSWKLVPTANGVVLRGSNPSAFSVSYNKTELVVAGKTYSSKGGMIPPRGVQDFPLEELKSIPSGALTLRYEWINDYGSSKSVETRLSN
ncbi:fimbria/pilus periplasmic chaperone [Pseudomonas caspiana]|uniref:fimbrial biogenesis chaperone n=1 Tax=Pseudomonas caspiana TaxID=1451454 RepID=UPI0032EF9053